MTPGPRHRFSLDICRPIKKERRIQKEAHINFYFIVPDFIGTLNHRDILPEDFPPITITSFLLPSPRVTDMICRSLVIEKHIYTHISAFFYLHVHRAYEAKRHIWFPLPKYLSTCFSRNGHKNDLRPDIFFMFGKTLKWRGWNVCRLSIEIYVLCFSCCCWTIRIRAKKIILQSWCLKNSVGE